MAAELGKLADLAEAQNSQAGANLIRANAQALHDSGMIPEQLFTPVDIVSFDDFSTIANGLSNEGYEAGSRIVRGIGETLISTGVLSPSNSQETRHLGVRKGSLPSNRFRIDPEMIRGFRAALGISQDELARRAGVSSSFVSSLEVWENGRRVHPEIARNLASALGVEVIDIGEAPKI